jgi:ribosomal protein L12E/L44/L45/RPP1/RPP2
MFVLKLYCVNDIKLWITVCSLQAQQSSAAEEARRQAEQERQERERERERRERQAAMMMFQQ